ncbi:MAG: ABC transporter permease [Prevotellaceae bacterium]|jgi:ABC-type lipoprotein release transport system permease subunit|nr:ABC transporter permease [Prevotellaceae bacterium]
MNLPFFIALRYLFSKKTHNIINIISLICAGGICVATLSLVCTLSVYNGFQHLISNLFNSFDPDLRITLVEGKTFDINAPEIKELETLDFIAAAATVLEENALIRNREKQAPVTVKGVSPEYLHLIQPDSVLRSGYFVLKDEDEDFTVIGAALASQIDAGIYFVNPVSLYAPKYNAKINLSNPEKAFNERNLFVSGIYATNQQEIDVKYAFVSLDFARELFDYGEVATAIELNLKKNADIRQAKAELQSILGENYLVQDKKEQHGEFYQMMKIEKWITFLILSFILLIAVFNVIGSLTMLIIEKKNDIQTLRSLGASSRLIRTIFLLEGWLITVFGALLGLITGLILCLIQQFFGIVKLNTGGMPDAFIVDAYPVYVQAADIFLILFTVLFIGFTVVWFPTRRLKV